METIYPAHGKIAGIEILKEALFSKGTLSPKQWEEHFQDLKKRLLWGKKGWGPDSEHWRRYTRDIEEWGRQLFPDLSDKKRKEMIKIYQKEPP